MRGPLALVSKAGASLLCTAIFAVCVEAKEADFVGNTDLSDKNLRTAQMVRSGEGQVEAIGRGNGIWESRGVGNSYLIVTDEGDVLVNAGTLADARRGKELFSRVSSNPIRHIVLTQSHANQYGGLEVYKTRDNEVIAHRFYPGERAYNGCALRGTTSADLGGFLAT